MLEGLGLNPDQESNLLIKMGLVVRAPRKIGTMVQEQAPVPLILKNEIRLKIYILLCTLEHSGIFCLALLPIWGEEMAGAA